MKNRVFISYAKEDSNFAKKLHTDLLDVGVDPWIDSYELLAGQDWDKTIREAIGYCSYFLALLSTCSVSKTGYVQKEIRKALDIADQKPEGSIFILPVRIDDCEPSFESLRRLHRTDLFPDYDQGLKELLRVFNYTSEEKPKLININTEKRDGKIVRLNNGYGFISYSLVKGDLFFHVNELKNMSFEDLSEGDIILFHLADGPKGQVAIDIERA